MKLRYILVTILTFLFITPNVNADACDAEDILNKKKYSEKITVTLQYAKDANGNDTGLYNIVIKDVTPEFTIIERKTNNVYSYEDIPENGIININDLTSGNYKIEVYSSECEGDLLRTINYKLPNYNHYANNPLCDGISEEELDVCNRAYQGKITDEIFEREINKYNQKIEQLYQTENENSNNIGGFLKKYYIYIIIAIVLIIIATGVFIFNKKRGVLE